MSPPRELRLRLGCPLALLVTAGLLAALEAIGALVADRPFRFYGWDFYLLFGGFTGAPFGALAIARARDWLAWLVAIAMTAAAWALLAWSHSPNEGVDFSVGFAFLFTPLAIAGTALAIAGMRGRIGWALEGDQSGD